ncbi:NAD(P)-binding protein [Aspergillus keveii]|uniref:NAD(P)-binding protein n=1 Tax=Aspergillus keveii TaxID=714993 RepID=A0ABR4FKY3_9EURO
MARNRGLYFAEVPTGVPVAGQHLRIKEEVFNLSAPPPTGGFTGQTLYASFDPYLRHLLVAPDKSRDGFTALPVGSIIPNTVLLRVLKSDTSSFKHGDVVVGFASIQEYNAIDSSQLGGFAKVHNPLNLDVIVFLGALAGEVLFVSAASGAVGQMVGQLAKRERLRVIGSAGTYEKTRILRDVFQFDGAFNYRTADPGVELRRFAPEGIDIYYDNSGGRQLEAAISCLRDHGRIIACGYASQYNVPEDQQYGIRNTGQIIGKRLTWRGLSVFDENMGGKYREEHQANVALWIGDQSLKVVMSETRGIANAARGLVELFEGRNVGKAVLSFDVVD